MRFAVLGAGKMGRAAVYDLARANGVTQVDVFDIDESQAQEVARKYGAGKSSGKSFDASKVAEGGIPNDYFRGYQAILSAVTYKYNPALTKLAIAGGAHFFDLGGNNDTVAEQFKLDALAKRANVIVIPDCGLAPGMVSIIAAGGIAELDTVDALRIRVGGLPQTPHPPLNYQMVFSAEGLINEYWEPVVILENGREKIVEPMSAVERLSFDGIGELEAFYTSGGTSTLPKTYAGKIAFLDYKTIRYPGHCALFRPMLEIGLGSRDTLPVNGQSVEPRALFKAVLDRNLSFNEPDLVLVRVIIEGTSGGRRRRTRFEIVDRQDPTTGLTAMMRTTSFPIAIIAWMAAGGHIKARGVVPQEGAVDPGMFTAELGKRGVTVRRYDDLPV